MTSKEDLHRLVDGLPDEDLDAIRSYAAFLVFRRLRNYAAHGLIGADTVRDLLGSGKPDEELAAAALAVIAIDDPMLRALMAAREDDEPTSPEEDVIADEGWREYRRGDYVTGESFKAGFPDEFPPEHSDR